MSIATWVQLPVSKPHHARVPRRQASSEENGPSVEETAEELSGREYSCGVIAFFWATRWHGFGGVSVDRAPALLKDLVVRVVSDRLVAVDCKVDYLRLLD
eukprot:Skav208534  [mRNA]  locus=scaffold1216:18506:19632:- [translate_table: standard]